MSGMRVTCGARREEALARRRDAEQDRLQLWGDVQSYFKGWEVKAHKHNDWTSNQYYDSNEECRKKAEKATKRRAQLESRRERLRALLTTEEEDYAQQMRLLAPTGPADDSARLAELQIFTDQLKRKKEEARHREAELKLHHQWRARTPRIRDHERTLHTIFVRDAWMDQLREKHKEMEQKELEEKEALKKREQDIIEEERKEKELEEIRRHRAVELQQQLLKQIGELREKEAQAEALKIEEAESMRKQAEIEAVAAERRLVEKKRKNIEHSWYLTQQWQLRLRRAVRAVQEELAFDLKVLERLIAQEAADRSIQAEQRSRARQEMLEAQSAIQEQARLEREREENMHFLFQEEARKMWEQQESRWNAEREARRKLVEEVFATLRAQIEEKLSRNLAEQRRLLGEREWLLNQVEEANAELKAQEKALAKSKTERRREIDQQVQDKTTRAMEQLRIDQEQIQLSIEEEKRQEEKILKEMKQMDAAGYKPKDTGRRKTFW